MLKRLFAPVLFFIILPCSGYAQELKLSDTNYTYNSREDEPVGKFEMQLFIDISKRELKTIVKYDGKEVTASTVYSKFEKLYDPETGKLFYHIYFNKSESWLHFFISGDGNRAELREFSKSNGHMWGHAIYVKK